MPYNTITYNDGNTPYGSVTMSFNAQTWIVEDNSGTANANVVDIPNEVGAIHKQIIIASKKSGTQTWQVPSTGSFTAFPKVGDTFTIPAGFGGSGSAFTGIVTQVDTPRANNDYWKINVGWVEKIN